MEASWKILIFKHDDLLHLGGTAIEVSLEPLAIDLTLTRHANIDCPLKCAGDRPWDGIIPQEDMDIIIFKDISEICCLGIMNTDRTHSHIQHVIFQNMNLGLLDLCQHANILLLNEEVLTLSPSLATPLSVTKGDGTPNWCLSDSVAIWLRWYSFEPCWTPRAFFGIRISTSSMSPISSGTAWTDFFADLSWARLNAYSTSTVMQGWRLDKHHSHWRWAPGTSNGNDSAQRELNSSKQQSAVACSHG